jgi:hypothetical protein
LELALQEGAYETHEDLVNQSEALSELTIFLLLCQNLQRDYQVVLAVENRVRHVIRRFLGYFCLTHIFEIRIGRGLVSRRHHIDVPMLQHGLLNSHV